jgi:hypothetical protein
LVEFTEIFTWDDTESFNISVKIIVVSRQLWANGED